MSTPLQFVWSALYVTFCYACVAFGALAFRTVADNLNFKGLQLGEELYQLFDPRIFVGLGAFAFFFCIFVVILWLKTDLWHEEVNQSAPGLLFLVIPMVLVVNMIQLYLRAKWQRTSVRTKGILIRRLFSERFFVVQFDKTQYHVSVVRESLWFKVSFYDFHDVNICTCAVGAKSLLRILGSVQSATTWVIDDVDDILKDSPLA